jgi:glycosyltransferase involved in cell wall biosynthesis/Flp pilus assembly protein TadD
MGKRKRSSKKNKSKAIIRQHSISACMIVRDEEELLPKCLESIKNYVDEIIVVDTGSTDRTVELAQDFGAKAYHHSWEADFSKHRNQSIGYATKGWILVIDADERLIRWDQRVNTLMGNKTIDALHVRVENVFGRNEGIAWHHSVRLFRNNGKVHYQGRVHNQLHGYGKSAFACIIIHHQGYNLDPDKEQIKFERTRSLLENEIRQDPHNAKYHHYLAVAYLGQQHYERSLKESRQALRLAADNGRIKDHLFLWTRFVTGVSLLNTGQLREAERICLEAINVNELHIDSYYLLGSICFHRNQLEAFLDYSGKYLSLMARLKNRPEEFGSMVHNTLYHEWRIRMHRGHVFEAIGQKPKAEKEYSLSLQRCHDQAEFNRQRALLDENRVNIATQGHPFQESGKYEPEEQQVEKGTLGESSHGNLSRAGKGQQIPARDRGKVKDSPTISLCMMVKNEQDNLPRCLESVEGCVDEIVIVDTGSTDGTIRIAESYGARVYTHPWEGHFSKHRNQSIGYATKDWILILDADESLAPGAGNTIRQAVKDETVDSVYFIVKNAFDHGRGEAVHNSIRLFRNNERIHYEGRVHNRLVGEKNSRVYPVIIHHQGYNLGPDKSKAKFIRTTTLLKEEINERPDHPRAYHYLAASYLAEQMYEDAIDSSLKAIDLADAHGFHDYIYLWSHFIAGISYLNTNRLNEAKDVCLKAIGRNQKHLDSRYLLAIIAYHQRNWEEVLVNSKKYFFLWDEIRKTPGSFGPMVHNTINHRWRVHLHRGFAWIALCRNQEAEKDLSAALTLCDDTGEYHRLLAAFYLAQDDLTAAEKHLTEARENGDRDIELFRCGAQIYRKIGAEARETEFLEEILKVETDDIQSLFRLGTINLAGGNHEKATDLFERTLEKNPSHTGALINLGIIAKRSGALNLARQFLEKALAEEPDSVDALSNLGYVYYGLDDLWRAKEIFERLTGLDPRLLDVRLIRAVIYLRFQNIEGVVAECDKIFELLGLDRNRTLNSLRDLGELFIHIGGVLLDQKKPALASLAFEVPIQLDGQRNQSLKEIGKICLDKGAYKSGLNYIEQATRLNPQDRETYSLIRQYSEKTGNKKSTPVYPSQPDA